jgi:hypothetical protein
MSNAAKRICYLFFLCEIGTSVLTYKYFGDVLQVVILLMCFMSKIQKRLEV